MSPYTLQLNKEAVKEKEEDKVLIWRDHYTAAVSDEHSNSASYPCASGSTASLTIVAFMLFIFALFSNAFFMCSLHSYSQQQCLG